MTEQPRKAAGSPAGTGGQYDRMTRQQRAVAVPPKGTAERLASIASAIRGRAADRDFFVTNTDSELSINTSYYEVDPDGCTARKITQSLTLRPGNGSFDVEALVYTEGELDADESSYSDDRQTPVTTDSDILEITEGYIDTIHAEMEDGLKNDTVSLTDPTYDEWFSMGMNLGVKSQWSSKFDADDARQWLDRGFTFEDAIMWDGSGFTPDQAGRLTEEGNFTKPAEVIEWRDRGGFSGYDACILREGGVTLDEAIDWHNGGFGALETVRLRADGISLKEAANWLKTGGFSGGEIAALHENNMSFEEVTGWSSITPFDGHEIIRLRSAGVTPKGAIEWIEKGGFDTYEVADLKMSGISLTEAIEWREDGRFRANEIADLHKSGIGLQQAIDLLADSGADLRDIRQLRSYNEEMSFVDALYQT